MDSYQIVALVLIALGVALLGAEILAPTGGILVVGALVFFALAVGVVLYSGTLIEAVVVVGGMAVGLPAAGFAAVSAWRRMSLDSALDAGATDAPAAAEVPSLKGRTGKTVSPLRPSGTAEFDGKRVDAMTEGTMLDAGVWVKCMEVKRGQVIVRRMENPPDVSGIEGEAVAGEYPAAAPKAAPPASEQPAPEPPKVEPKRPRDDFDDFDIGLDKI